MPSAVRKAWVRPVDELADEDRPVAADVILRVGSTSTQATITAYLPDGAITLWADDTALKGRFGVVMVH
jgi:hypothetical protein